MKRTIFIIILAYCLSMASPTIATCFLSKKENVVGCSTHDNEVCCVIVYTLDDQRCFEAWCNDVNQCVWEMVIKTSCSYPGQSDP